jgi:hypothetical protein
LFPYDGPTESCKCFGSLFKLPFGHKIARRLWHKQHHDENNYREGGADKALQPPACERSQNISKINYYILNNKLIIINSSHEKYSYRDHAVKASAKCAPYTHIRHFRSEYGGSHGIHAGTEACDESPCEDHPNVLCKIDKEPTHEEGRCEHEHCHPSPPSFYCVTSRRSCCHCA